MFRHVWQILHKHLFQAAGIVGRSAKLPPDLQDYVLRQSQGKGTYEYKRTIKTTADLKGEC
jgi:hypothetical protein